VADETPKPAPVTDEVVINQTTGGETAPQANWPSGKPDPVAGPFALALFVVFVVMGGATFAIMHWHPETATAGYAFLPLLMLALIAAYNAYQNYRNGKALRHATVKINEVSERTADVHQAVKDAVESVNKVSRSTTEGVTDAVNAAAKDINSVSERTTNSVKDAIKDKAKEAVKEAATEHPPVAVVVPAAALAPVEVQPEPAPKPLHKRILPGKKGSHHA
jgi:type IV secretory pathway TrbL component